MNDKDKSRQTMKKEKRNIRKKLYAAMSMLLVCAILLTTATYAWLSLSVAPSVEKISTTITGNGSLEVALATSDIIENLDMISDFESLTGFDKEGNYDSASNTNWGNLVDLSDDKYGFSLLKMYPALLNITGDKVGENPLKVANFGADGRVTFLNSDTTSAMYDKNTGSFLLNGKTDYGVRALGVSTSTGLWNALEDALRDTRRDSDALMKQRFDFDMGILSLTKVTIANYIELMAMDKTVSSGIYEFTEDVMKAVMGTDPVEATETTEAVEGKDGLMDKLDKAVRNLILACSGYSDRYVSVTADEMVEIADSDISTVEIINEYVLPDTDLANLCGYYVTAAEHAEKMEARFALMSPSDESYIASQNLELFANDFFGDSFTVNFSAIINRTVTVEKVVKVEENGETVEKTVTETVVTHEGDYIYADTLDGLNAQIEALNSPAEGEVSVVSSEASYITKNIKVEETDNLLGAIAQISGTFGNTDASSIDTWNDYLLKRLSVVIPCHTEKTAVDQLSSVEREFAYQENLFTLQTMWNQLDVQRNALAAAIDGEMKALVEIVQTAKYFEDNNRAYDDFEAAVKSDSNYQHSLHRMDNYNAPESAGHETLQKHVDTMQDALDFYYDFTVQAALTYASKDTTNLNAYISLTDLLATEEDERSIPLEDIIAAVGTGFTEQYADAISGYNAAQQAVKNAQEKINIYNIKVEEEIKTAQANGTTPPLHPTWQEDLDLRSAFTDTSVMADYITATEPTGATAFSMSYDGGIVYDLIELGLGRYANSTYTYYQDVDRGYFLPEFEAARDSGVRYVNIFTPQPALFKAWLEMTDQTSYEGAKALNEKLRPLVQVYDQYGYWDYDHALYDTTYETADLARYHTVYQSYDANELFAMGYPAQERYDKDDVSSIRTAYTQLNKEYLPKANNFIRATVENYLLETGLVNDDNITVTDANGNVVTNTSVKTLLKGIVDTAFTDATKPMADRLESELKTAIGNVPYAEFRAYADQLTDALSAEHVIWSYIMEAAADYDAVLVKMTELDTGLKTLEAADSQQLIWDDIYNSVRLVTGEPQGGRYYTESEGSSRYTFYLSADSVFTELVALYSDKFEYETYNRGGTWRYAPYNVEQGPLPELELGLIRSIYSNWELEAFDTAYLYVLVQPENGHGGYITAEHRTLGTYRDFFVRAEQFTFNPANGITPLYNLAVNNTKSVQTDRSIIFRQLVKDMKLAKSSAEDSRNMIDLQTLADYIGKTMYHSTSRIEYAQIHNASAKLEDARTYVNERMAEIESYTYDEVETLITTLDGVTKGMNSYKDSLRTAFMLWASSANGTKDAYKAVASNYTGTIDDMMAEAGLKAGNLYFDIYSDVQDILAKVQRSRELLTTILAGKPENATENDIVQPAALRDALKPLAGETYYNVSGTDLFATFTIKNLTLCSDDSVLGKIYSLYTPDATGAAYYSYPVTQELYAQFNAESVNKMQRAINTAIEGGITFDSNVSANSTASAILSDSYAFAIDLLLRTNADNSNLLLQTEEKQRIYDEEFGAVETMGGGSVLTYTVDKMTREQLEEINSCVRVVFTDTTTGEILACAKPDKLVIPDPSYEDIFGDTATPDEEEEVTTKMAGYLHLCDYEITDSGILYMGETLDSAAIMPLSKNKTTPITVYVYLDGNEMKNSMASGMQDVLFDMNLQFASDAELVPANAELNVS